MSQIPQMSPGGPGRPQPPADDQKPVGKTSEEFNKLIEKVDATDAEKHGKRRGRPKAEEEPEVPEEEASFSQDAAPPPVSASLLNIPESQVFSYLAEDSLTGLNAPTAYSTTSEPPQVIESWNTPSSSSSSNVAPVSTTPPPTKSSSASSSSTSSTEAPVSTTRALQKTNDSTPSPADVSTESTKKVAASRKPKETVVAKAKKEAVAPKKSTTRKKIEMGVEDTAVKGIARTSKVKTAKSTSPTKTTKKVPAEEISEDVALKKKPLKPSAAAKKSEKPSLSVTERKRSEKAEKESVEETVAPGLPYLAQAALHHVSTVPVAHGSKIEALSNRPLPIVSARAIQAIGAAAGAIGPSLSRSQGVERVLAALKAAVLTLQEQPDKRTLTITLKGDPRLAGTALDGLKIVVEEYASAPKQYNITLEASAEAQALLSGSAANMADQLNRLGRDRGWIVQRLDVQVGRPLFHRKGSTDMQGGGGHGGKTK